MLQWATILGQCEFLGVLRVTRVATRIAPTYVHSTIESFQPKEILHTGYTLIPHVGLSFSIP